MFVSNSKKGKKPEPTSFFVGFHFAPETVSEIASRSALKDCLHCIIIIIRVDLKRNRTWNPQTAVGAQRINMQHTVHENRNILGKFRTILSCHCTRWAGGGSAEIIPTEGIEDLLPVVWAVSIVQHDVINLYNSMQNMCTVGCVPGEIVKYLELY